MRLALALLIGSAPAFADPPAIKPAAVVDTMAAAVDVAIDAKTPTGEWTIVATIEKYDPAKPSTRTKDVDAIRAAIAKRGWTTLEDRDDGSRVIVIQTKTGARATLSLGDTGGMIAVTLRPTSATAPGKCTAIPKVEHHVLLNSSGINDSGDSFDGTTRWVLDTARFIDVDGDGILDAFVPVAPNADACPELVSYRVFVVRGTCGHEIGTVGPGQLAYGTTQVPLAASGYRPITMTAQSSVHGKQGIPEMTTTTRRFEVAGGRYKQVDIKSRTGVCHHCAVWHCNKE